ncbi:MAG: hypothetical protein ACJ71U_09250 [Terriglobales bacterium]
MVHAKKADGHQLILDRYMTMIPALDLPEAKYAVLRAAERELPAQGRLKDLVSGSLSAA